MKLKNLTLALLLTVAAITCVQAQDSSSTTSTTTTTSTTEEASEKPDYMKIYGWVGGILIAIVAIGVIGFEMRTIKKDEEEAAAEESSES